MKNSYRFFQNKECEYFPCHKVNKEDTFNCMFCYCPLYFLENCGGNHKDCEGIKDCSACLVPHSENGYDYIIEKIMNHNNNKIRSGNKK